MKILNLLTIIDKKHPLYVFFSFVTSKFWNCWAFYPTGTMSRTHTFEKRQCDRCQHRSAVKNTPPPSLSLPVPIPPPTAPTTPAPTAQSQWYRAFRSCDLLGQWRAVPGAKHRNPFSSVPRARKTGSSSGEKGLSLSEGLGKEYMKWRKTSVGKRGAQAEGTCSN
jgi:hypothetical protein